MSQQNVEIVRRAYELWDAGDLNGLARLGDQGIVTQRHEADAAVWHGAEGFVEAVADWTSRFEEFSSTAEEFIDAGDRVIARIHQTGRGRSSGAPVEANDWFVHTLRNGKVTRVDMFTTRAQALEAVGLSE